MFVCFRGRIYFLFSSFSTRFEKACFLVIFFGTLLLLLLLLLLRLLFLSLPLGAPSFSSSFFSFIFFLCFCFYSEGVRILYSNILLDSLTDKPKDLVFLLHISSQRSRSGISRVQQTLTVQETDLVPALSSRIPGFK